MPKTKPTTKIGWLIVGLGLVVTGLVVGLVVQPPTQANSTNQAQTDKPVDLNIDQRQIIRSQCLTIQVKQVLRAQTELNQINRPRYERSIDEIINHLRNGQLGLVRMGEDSSEIDLALVYLVRHRNSLRQALTDYDLALTQLTVIDCKQDPAGFVAEIRRAQASQQLVVDRSQDLVSFIDNELNQALQKTHQQLLEIQSEG